MSGQPGLDEICERFTSNLSRYFGDIEFIDSEPKILDPVWAQQAHVDYIAPKDHMDLKSLNRLLLDPMAASLANHLKRKGAVATFNLPLPGSHILSARSCRNGMAVRGISFLRYDEKVLVEEGNDTLVRFDVLYQTATTRERIARADAAQKEPA